MLTPLIILDHNVGRLGNGLIQSMHLAALALETNGNVVLIPLDPYSTYFTHLQRNLVCSLPRSLPLIASEQFRKRWMVRGKVDNYLRRIWSRLNLPKPKIWRSEMLPMDLTSEIDAMRQSSFHLFSGWFFHVEASVFKHRARLRELFSINPRSCPSAIKFIAELRSRYKILIGCAMRQTDYRRYCLGKFFLTQAEYVQHLRRLAAELGTEEYCFVITSDEPIEWQLFSGLSAYFPNGSEIEDFCCLSKCDYVLSTYSTFSQTAAFIGGVKICYVDHQSASPVLEQFQLDEMLSLSEHFTYQGISYT